MNTPVKPVIVVSKCLGFDKCRYNGQTVPVPFLEKLRPFVEYIPVCPEMEIGLGVPRQPIRIVLDNDQPRLIQPATERDVTDLMTNFVNDFLDSLGDVDGIVLKNRSPSCGIFDVKMYHGFEKSARSSKGRGFFGGVVHERFPGMPIEDEGRLMNFTLRENFLTKLFTFTRLRQVRASGKMRELVEFHSNHKLLFLAYNQSRYRVCGRIVANHEKHDFETVITNYAQELKLIMRATPKDRSLINMLMHAFGGVSKHLPTGEKQFFLNSIEEYRDERIPLSALNHLIHSYAIRFNSEYLLKQVFINPYPKELVAITDSGKGRNY